MVPHTQLRNQAQAHGSGTVTPQGSATQTITGTSALRNDSPDSLVLRLRGAHHRARTRLQSRSRSQSPETAEPSQRSRRTIQWAEDVVDNEGLGRKKSKVCCIFHKSREVGESSSEDDSSSSSSDSDEGSSDDGAARPIGKRGRRGRDREHNHHHEEGDRCDGHGHEHGDSSLKSTRRKPSPNAYEKMPKYDVQPLQRPPKGS